MAKLFVNSADPDQTPHSADNNSLKISVVYCSAGCRFTVSSQTLKWNGTLFGVRERTTLSK